MGKINSWDLAVKICKDNNILERDQIECVDIILKSAFAFDLYKEEVLPSEEKTSLLIGVISAFVNELKEIREDPSNYKKVLQTFHKAVVNND